MSVVRFVFPKPRLARILTRPGGLTVAEVAARGAPDAMNPNHPSQVVEIDDDEEPSPTS